MKKKTILMTFLFFCFFVHSRAEEIIKSGFNLGALPAVSYNSDLGFQYGVILNLFHYGDGSRYPAFDHSMYLECVALYQRYRCISALLRFGPADKRGAQFY
jgi:hypothetical protein